MRELELLYEALNSDHGLEVEVFGSMQAAMVRLYSARRSDPDLEAVQISRSPVNPEKALWIVKAAQRPTEAKPISQNPKGEGPLYSLADFFGDD